jgi:outer membrane usher protein FimD/PapC
MIALAIMRARRYIGRKGMIAMTEFFERLGRAAGMAKQAMQKTKAQEIDSVETLPGHGKLSIIVNEKPDGTTIVLLKAKGAEATVYVGFDREQLEAFKAEISAIRL